MSEKQIEENKEVFQQVLELLKSTTKNLPMVNAGIESTCCQSTCDCEPSCECTICRCKGC